MGGVGLLDASVAIYRIHIKGKKGWWQHFVVLITKKTFYFVRSVVQSYLHVDKIALTLAPDFWKSRTQIADSHLTGCSHWHVTIKNSKDINRLLVVVKSIVCEE